MHAIEEGVDIVIVNWNTRGLLRKCLTSIKECIHSRRFRTIVVDNGSSDGSVEMVISEFPRVVVISNQNNHGFAAATNQGYLNSGGGGQEVKRVAV